MTRSTRSFPALCAALSVLTSILAKADDWPQWQGPERNAISKERGLLQEWPEGGPPLAWKMDKLGGGDSAPSIADGRIYFMSNRDGDEVVWALSETDGREVWVKRLGPAFAQRSLQSREGPGCTPTVDGQHLYVEGLAGNVVCLRAKDGELVWQRSLTEDFGGRVPMWSYRESPLVDGDKVICTPGGEEATLVALNKLTGETIWKARLPGESAGSAAARPDGPPTGTRGAPGGQGGGAMAEITGTEDSALFMSEHFGMSAFSCKLPNGEYLAKLYFAETYDGITGPGQRVFSFNVQGHAFNDFDIWVKAGGPRRAYLETVPIEITQGEFRLVFTPKVENPAIKAIEIVPRGVDAAGEASSAAIVRINAGRSTPFTDASGRVWQPDTGFEGGMVNPGVGFGGRREFGGRRGGPGGGGPGSGGSGGGAGAAYASVIAIEFEGQRQYVQLLANTLAGFAAADGKFLWRYDRPANRMGINCTTPFYINGFVFASSAYGVGGGLAKLTGNGTDEIKAEEVWFSSEMENHHGGVVLVDGCLYGANGGNGGGYLTCLDFKTGKALWSGQDVENRVRKGSIATADGRLYYRTEQGELLLIEPNATRYIERGRFEQPDRRRPPAWAHPVIANGKLYIRDQDVLFCYDIRAQ